jgi:hypothetical protein
MSTATTLDKVAGACAFEAGSIDAAKGIFRNVALITGGVEALGHGSFIDDETVRGLAAMLVGRSLPAYITHEGTGLFGGGDRLTTEVGVWSGIHLDAGKLRATQFQFLKSFEDHEPAKRDRLVELAQKMPDQFGVSLVGRIDLKWATPNGDQPVIPGMDTPEDALFDYPSVRFLEVESADFVKSPAANPDGLFSRKSEALAEVAPVDAPAVGMSEEVTLSISAEVVEHLKADFERLSKDFTAERETLQAQLATKTAELIAAKEQADRIDEMHKTAAEAAKTAFAAERERLQSDLKTAKELSAARLGVPPVEVSAAEITAPATDRAGLWERYRAIKDPVERSSFYRQYRAQM